LFRISIRRPSPNRLPSVSSPSSVACPVVRQLFVRPEPALATHEPEFTVIAARSLRPCPIATAPAQHFLFCRFHAPHCADWRTKYAGEMKKSIFGVMNFLLPNGRQRCGLPCTARPRGRGWRDALFLAGRHRQDYSSADPARRLIGTTSMAGVPPGIQFERVLCEVRHLSERKEPQIYRPSLSQCWKTDTRSALRA